MRDGSRTGSSSAEPYSPQLRTALVLTGSGTAGAYHAGILRALHEAGVKLDIVAGRGIGAVGALFAAIDGAQRLWDEKGFWRRPAIRSLYPWRPVFRFMVVALAVAVAIVAFPLLAIALGLVIFPIDFVLKMVGFAGSPGLVASYLRLAQSASAPGALPTWLPRLVLLVLGVAVAIAMASGRAGSGSRRRRGAAWWHMVRGPLSPSEASEHCWRVMWDSLRGATHLGQPTPLDLGRRYTELLSENIGQPGFRELLIAAHDLDAHRDMLFALVAEPRRQDLVRRMTTQAAEARRAEVIDLAGVGRDHLVDAIAAAVTIPIATDVHRITFTSDSFWRGETHRLCDRPGSVARLVDELSSLGAHQIIIAYASAAATGPHALAAPRLDLRSRIGEYLQSSEMAAIRDLTHLAASSPRIFTIHPAHNPLGPFDFAGGYDDRSDRRHPLDELMSRGYEDAYHQFIEPVVGASGDRVGQSAV